MQPDGLADQTADRGVCNEVRGETGKQWVKSDVVCGKKKEGEARARAYADWTGFGKRLA